MTKDISNHKLPIIITSESMKLGVYSRDVVIHLIKYKWPKLLKQTIHKLLKSDWSNKAYTLFGVPVARTSAADGSIYVCQLI